MICKEAKPRKRWQSQESTPTNYAGAVKASNQKLTITRKESERDDGIDNMDKFKVREVREVQST